MAKSAVFKKGRALPRQYVKHVSDAGKPCPTCYSPMTRTAGSPWLCAKHGEPTRP